MVMVMFFQIRINLSKSHWLGFFAACAVVLPSWPHSVVAQQTNFRSAGDQGPSNATLVVAGNLPSQPTFVPIGTRSLVDQYRSDPRQPDVRVQTRNVVYPELRSSERYVVRLPQSGFAAPPLPATGAAPMVMPENGGMGFPSQTVTPSPGFQEPSVAAPFGLPTGTGGSSLMSNPVASPAAASPATALPAAASPATASPATTAPPTGLPPALPMNPAFSGTVPVAGLPSTQVISRNADMVPIARPELNVGFATVGNSCLVSAPSSYVTAMGLGNCAGGSYQPTTTQGYIATGPQVASLPQAAASVPSGLVPVTRPSAPGVPKKPLINFGQDKNSVVVGQGLIGQPVAYVPGQCIRNWIRYISP